MESSERKNPRATAHSTVRPSRTAVWSRHPRRPRMTAKPSPTAARRYIAAPHTSDASTVRSYAPEGSIRRPRRASRTRWGCEHDCLPGHADSASIPARLSRKGEFAMVRPRSVDRSPPGAGRGGSAVRQSPSYSLGGDDIAFALVQQERIVQRSGLLVATFSEFEGVGQSDEGARAGVQLVTLLGTIYGTACELLCGRRFPSQRGQLRACAIVEDLRLVVVCDGPVESQREQPFCLLFAALCKQGLTEQRRDACQMPPVLVAFEPLVGNTEEALSRRLIFCHELDLPRHAEDPGRAQVLETELGHDPIGRHDQPFRSSRASPADRPGHGVSSPEACANRRSDGRFPQPASTRWPPAQAHTRG